MPIRTSCIAPPGDYKSLIPEERQLFGKYVHDLRKADKWLTLEEAQRSAYQMVLLKSMEGFE
jgi:hypothetical protein